jgi:hypothetical protein
VRECQLKDRSLEGITTNVKVPQRTIKKKKGPFKGYVQRSVQILQYSRKLLKHILDLTHHSLLDPLLMAVRDLPTEVSCQLTFFHIIMQLLHIITHNHLHKRN